MEIKQIHIQNNIDCNSKNLFQDSLVFVWIFHHDITNQSTNQNFLNKKKKKIHKKLKGKKAQISKCQKNIFQKKKNNLNI